MNKFLTLGLAVLFSICGFSQDKMIALTKYTDVTDTIWLMEDDILKVTKTATGSSLEYLDAQGDFAGADIRERTVDTAAVAATVTIVFSGGAGSVDSILINGVNIIANPVAFNTNITTTVADLEDSIDAQTQSPVVYTAANADSTLTISAPAAFGDTANDYTVVVYTTTLTSTTNGVMAGGFTVVRNITVHTERIFNVTVGGASVGINADRITGFKKTTSGGTVIWYNGKKTRTLESTDQPDAILTVINNL